MRTVAFMFLVASLYIAGCSIKPDGSNGLRRELVLPGVGYEAAYHRAIDFMHACHRGLEGFAPTITSGDLFPDTRTAEARIAPNDNSVIERILIADKPAGSQVRIVVIHRPGKWDERELDAAQRSLETGAPSCR